jgi:hypothetical protein
MLVAAPARKSRTRRTRRKSSTAEMQTDVPDRDILPGPFGTLPHDCGTPLTVGCTYGGTAYDARGATR